MADKEIPERRMPPHLPERPGEVRHNRLLQALRTSEPPIPAATVATATGMASSSTTISAIPNQAGQADGVATASTVAALGPTLVDVSSFETAAGQVVARPPRNLEGALSGATETFAPPSPSTAPAPRRTARTVVGSAVLANGTSIILALVGVQMQIEGKLDSLKKQRLNSDEWHEEIADYEDLKAKVEAILDASVRYFTSAAEEDKLVKDAQSFTATLRDIWDKRQLQIADGGLFLTLASVCHLMGTDANLAALICGTLVAPKTVVEALKAYYGKEDK